MLCRRCFTVRKSGVTWQKVCENGPGKNPRGTGTSLAAKRPSFTYVYVKILIGNQFGLLILKIVPDVHYLLLLFFYHLMLKYGNNLGAE